MRRTTSVLNPGGLPNKTPEPIRSSSRNPYPDLSPESESTCSCGISEDDCLDYIDLPTHSANSSINSRLGYYPRTYPQDLSSLARSPSYSNPHRYSQETNVNERHTRVRIVDPIEDAFDEPRNWNDRDHSNGRDYHDPTCTTLNCRRPSCLVPDYLGGDCEGLSCTCCQEETNGWHPQSTRRMQTSYTQPRTRKSLYQLRRDSPDDDYDLDCDYDRDYENDNVDHYNEKPVLRGGCPPFPTSPKPPTARTRKVPQTSNRRLSPSSPDPELDEAESGRTSGTDVLRMSPRYPRLCPFIYVISFIFNFILTYYC